MNIFKLIAQSHQPQHLEEEKYRRSLDTLKLLIQNCLRSRYTNLTLLALGLILSSFLTKSATAKKPFLSYTTTPIPGTSFNYTAGSNTYTFGSGNDLQLESITADGGKIYRPQELADQIFIRRVDNALVSGERCNIFVERGSGDLDAESSFPNEGGDCSVSEVLKDLIVNRGVLDVFSNQAGNATSETPNNIERVDFVFSQGIVASSDPNQLDEAGHIVMEKSGNNPVKVAAITAIDAAGNPTAFKPTRVTINRSDYGRTGARINNNFLVDPSTSGGVSNPQYQRQTNEQVGGVLVTLNDFGIGAGEIYYGFVMFGTDVPDATDLLQTQNFPQNTPHGVNNTGGADWQGGMGGFWYSDEYEPGDLLLSGQVFEDTNDSDLLENNEPGLNDISVSIYLDDGDNAFETNGSDILLETTETNLGNYNFSNLTPNQKYWVKVDSDDVDLNDYNYGGGDVVANQVNPRLVSVTTEEVANINFPFDVDAPQSIDNLNFCYLVADGTTGPENRAQDLLTKLDHVTGEEIAVGDGTGTNNIEAIAFDTVNNILYAGNAGQFGVIDLSTGVFSRIGGTNFGDIDGLAINPFTREIFASIRRSSGALDQLIKIDPATGTKVGDAFGTGVDTIDIAAINGFTDIDDITVDPQTGQIYGIANNNTGGDTLITITPSPSGASTSSVGILGVRDMEGFSSFFDGSRFFGTTGNFSNINSNSFYQIDVDTGNSTYKFKLGVNFGGGVTTDYEAVDCATAGFNTLSGKVFNDLNINGVFDGSDTATSSVTVQLYRDRNGDGILDNNDDISGDGILDQADLLASQETDSNGDYTFRFEATGAFIVQVDPADLPAGVAFTTNSGNNLEVADFGSAVGNNITDKNFGYKIALDFGDAPDTYGTDLIANNSSNSSDPVGASHVIFNELYLGTTIPDGDIDGFVDGTDDNNNASDDDETTGSGNGDDEDNFTLPTLTQGDTSYTIPAANITATNNIGEVATLHAWIDFNQDGEFTDTEHTSTTVNNNTNNGNPTADLNWNSITVNNSGTTYARFRLTTDNTISATTPGGEASNGEVEDYQIAIASALTVSPAMGQIVINEVLYRQTGNSAAGNDEFIELYNASGEAVDLSNWQLIDGNLQIDDTDGAGSINDGITESFVFPDGTIVNPGEYVVVWIGTDTPDRQADEAAFQFYLSNAPRLNNNGDDVWLYDPQTRIVDYMAYGTNNAINTPPDVSLNLWDDSFQSDLLNTSQTRQSISLTPNGQDINSAACWEATTSNDAEGRCAGFLPTRDSDEVGNRISSVGISNNIFKISGTVFEDINYGGGLGRNFATAESSATSSGFSTIGVEFAIVELYSYDGTDRNSSELVTIAETDENGYYIFEEDDDGEELPPGHYLIRVVNDGIESRRESSGLGHLAVQTFRNDPDATTTEITNEVGGAYPAVADDDSENFANSLPANAQSVTAISGTGEVSNVDFGFNFNTIVNTNNEGRGSLRQFLINSQDLDNENLAQDLPTTITAPMDSNGNPVTLTDYETSIFMIPDPNSDSRVNLGTATGEINLTNTPPDGGVGNAFVIDISGNDELRVFSENISIDGRTQTVNTPNTPNRAIGSNETTGPKVILTRSSTGDIIYAQDSHLIFHSLGIISLGNTTTLGLRISDDGGTGRQLADTNNVIMEELTVSTGSCGIQGVTMTESVIRNSIIRDSGRDIRSVCNNIQLREESNTNLIENNLILRSSYYGIHVISNSNNENIIRNNDIVGNGAARRRSQTSGIRLRDATNTTITGNIIRDNVGDGITINSNSNRLPANNGNLISKNSIYNNGDLGIDLDSGRFSRGNGVTDNDTGDSDTGANQLQNFPLVTNITSDGTNYTIEGSLNSTPSSNFEIEVYSNAVCNPNITGAAQTDDYGEGEKYHNTTTVTTDGTGNTTFSTTVAIADLAGNVITATATSPTSNNTSEFSQCFTTSPDLLLVKRITAINPGQSDERLFSTFVDDGTDDDTNPMWLGANGNSNTYTLGEINGGLVKPGDEVEYTIYFLSYGSDTAKNVLVCDLIPDNMEFVPRSFRSEPAASGGLSGADRGILFEYYNDTTDSRTRESLTNDNDGDSGYYFAPGVEPKITFDDGEKGCRNSPDSPPSPANTHGAVVVKLEAIPGATAPGTPTNSYGFIRFRAKVQ